MTATEPSDVAALAEVLDAHGYGFAIGANRCLCGAVIHDDSQFRAHLATVLARHVAAQKAEVLRAFADTRGVHVGDEDSEWWQGYRQAQRECLYDALRAARIDPTTSKESH